MEKTRWEDLVVHDDHGVLGTLGNFVHNSNRTVAYMKLAEEFGGSLMP